MAHSTDSELNAALDQDAAMLGAQGQDAGATLEDFDFGPDDKADCPNCGGDGFVASCWEEWACIDPEGGCDDCTRPCDWCNGLPANPEGDA